MSVDTNNAAFQDALNLIQYTRQSVFLTGKAGTGKSTFLRYVCEHTKKKHVVLAPTGIAAINAGGSTMHSFFKLPFYPLLPDDPNLSLQRGRIHEFFKYTKPHRKLLEQIELVIIDEISMVRADLIDAIDRILRVYSHNLREPFGGKQLLLVGDVFQLEPVVKNDEREILNRAYPTPYFFSARVFSQIDLVSIELQKVYRQTDSVFVSVLDHIRTNTAGAADLQLLGCVRLDENAICKRLQRHALFLLCCHATRCARWPSLVTNGMNSTQRFQLIQRKCKKSYFLALRFYESLRTKANKESMRSPHWKIRALEMPRGRLFGVSRHISRPPEALFKMSGGKTRIRPRSHRIWPRPRCIFPHDRQNEWRQIAHL